MNYIEIILFISYILIGLYSAYSDLKHGVVKNKTLLTSFIVSITIDFIYYYSNQLLIKSFIFNQLIILVVSFGLFKTGVWGGGDSKLFICLSLLFPAKFYVYGFELSPFSFVLIISFSISFVYLIFDSLKNLHNKDLTRINSIKSYFSFEFIKNIIIVSMFFYIVDFVLYMVLFFLKINEPYIIIQFINIIVVIGHGFPSIKDEKIIFCVGFIFFFILFLSTRYSNYKFDVVNLLYVLFILIVKILVGQFNYLKINSEDLKEGMILSRYSTMLMIPSKIKNLPTSLKEDMNSRLTSQEVEACKKWSNSAIGTNEFIIVRKMPFASFITIASIIYMVMGLIITL